MRNEVIKAVKRGDGAKIIAWFKKKYPDLQTNCDGINSEEDGDKSFFYGYLNDGFDVYNYATVTMNKAEILPMPSDYPKLMLVSKSGNCWPKRVVFMEKNGKFLGWEGAESFEEAENVTSVSVWNFAKDIEEPVITEVTLEEVAKLMGKKVEEIRIKDHIPMNGVMSMSIGVASNSVTFLKK